MLASIVNLIERFQGEILTVLVMLAIGLVVRFIERRRHERREFLGTLTLGYNKLLKVPGEDPFLLLDTWDEVPLLRVMMEGRILVERIMKATKKCTEQCPFIELDGEDMALMQNAIINYLSKITNAWRILEAGGVPSTEFEVIAVACFEPYGEMKARKPRAMLIRSELLEQFLDPHFRAALRYKRAHHRDRMTTLLALAKLWETERRASHDERRFIRTVRISVPTTLLGEDGSIPRPPQS